MVFAPVSIQAGHRAVRAVWIGQASFLFRKDRPAVQACQRDHDALRGMACQHAVQTFRMLDVVDGASHESAARGTGVVSSWARHKGSSFGEALGVSGGRQAAQSSAVSSVVASRKVADHLDYTRKDTRCL